MPVSQASTDITQRIQHLLDERLKHAEAITSIDATLARVGAALGSNGQAPKPAAAVTKAPAPAKLISAKPKAKRREFALSGIQSILAFVKSKSNPKGGEIEAHWKAEGRKGRAINLTSKLVKDKKLKRLPLKGERGSRYSLA